jgi:hypothetical protein
MSKKGLISRLTLPLRRQIIFGRKYLHLTYSRLYTEENTEEKDTAREIRKLLKRKGNEKS